MKKINFCLSAFMFLVSSTSIFAMTVPSKFYVTNNYGQQITALGTTSEDNEDSFGTLVNSGAGQQFVGELDNTAMFLKNTNYTNPVKIINSNSSDNICTVTESVTTIVEAYGYPEVTSLSASTSDDKKCSVSVNIDQTPSNAVAQVYIQVKSAS